MPGPLMDSWMAGGWQRVPGPHTLLSRRGSLCTAVRDGIELPWLPPACHRQLSQADPLELGGLQAVIMGQKQGGSQWVPLIALPPP